MANKQRVLIIGGGLAGLCAARTLSLAGTEFMLLEASDWLGGRVRTDVEAGFRMDRGFQVLLTAYPEASAVLDLPKLDLRRFLPGAAVFHQGACHTLLDPWRCPSAIFESAISAVGSVGDKVRVGLMRSALQSLTMADVYHRPESTIQDALLARGFSHRFIDMFWRPFFGGITLDPSLSSSSRMMEFVFSCVSRGDAAVPLMGMQAIVDQIASNLPAEAIRLNTRVHQLEGTAVRTSAGDFVADALIVACEGPAAAALLGRTMSRQWRGVTNMYFAIDGQAPIREPILVLDGEKSDLVTNLAFMSSVSEAYAPQGKSLASVTLLGLRSESEAQLIRAVQQQMIRWFGAAEFARWHHLRTYRIRHGLPDQSPPWLTRPDWPVRVAPGVYRAGDTVDTASIDGAMRSGRLAAEAVLHDLHATIDDR